MNSSQKAFTKMYEQAGQAAQGQPQGDAQSYEQPGENEGPGPEGDVVDGDFKEI